MSGWERLWRKDGTGWRRCCLDRSGVSVAILAGRFAAGDSIAMLAKDYDVPRASIEQALALYISASPSGNKVEERMAKILKDAGRDFSESGR